MIFWKLQRFDGVLLCSGNPNPLAGCGALGIKDHSTAISRIDKLCFPSPSSPEAALYELSFGI